MVEEVINNQPERTECLFCQVIKTRKNVYIIAENEGVMAILDKFPVSDGHVLLITKKHFANLSKVEEESWIYLLPLVKGIMAKLKKVFQPAGFNVISNLGEVAAQSIFHFHIHIIPKYESNQGFIWTTQPKLKYNLTQVAEKLK